MEWAYREIAAYASVIDSMEVWGAEYVVPDKESVIVSPDTLLHAKIFLNRHECWASDQERSVLVA